ncbi:type II toxin-antitoxin system RelE/ParE family toxin [Patescibacteria group bacterium]|nr:type II toxin-antitoxin system RelE/ParE family toxin [Patescibacteria group bacterium]
MMVILAPSAKKDLKKLEKFTQLAVYKKLKSLETDSLPLGVKKLSGYKNIYRIRIGKYRIIYQLNKNTVYIILILPRLRRWRI